MRVAFIGAGKMAEALIKGLLKAGVMRQEQIFASDIDRRRLKYLQKKYRINVFGENLAISSISDVVILSVKPQVMDEVLGRIGGKIKRNQLVISIAAGIRLSRLEKAFPKVPVIRVMPNNPALIGEGISAISSGKFAKDKDIKITEKIFSSVGETLRVPEKLMDSVTALSGSGPGFIYYFLEALIEGGIAAGLPRDISKRLAIQTALGSIRTVKETNKSPEELRGWVTSPSGTTLAGLKVLDKRKFKKTVLEAIVAAKERAFELSRV